MKKLLFITLLAIIGATATTQAYADDKWQNGQGITILLKNGETVTFSDTSIDSVKYVGKTIGFKVYLNTGKTVDFLYSQVETVTYTGQGEEPPAPDNNKNRNQGNNLTRSPQSWRLEFPHLRESGNQSYVTKSTQEFGITYSAEWDNNMIANRWSCYEMYAGNMLDVIDRTNDFKEDTALPSATRSKLSDYSGSGYSRGHLCPSADRKCSEEQNKQTFFLSNMQPQWQSHNSGQWASLENDIRSWAGLCDTLYIVKAATIDDVTLNGTTESGVYSKSYNGKTYSDLVCNDRLPVPKYFYMALLAYDKSSNTYKAMAVWTKHYNGTTTGVDNATHDWPIISRVSAEYITISELESRTGIDFFCNLPDDIEAEVESTLDRTWWSKGAALTK